MARKDRRSMHAMGIVAEFIAFITMFLVMMLVGFGAISGSLEIPLLGFANTFVGWMIVLLALMSFIAAVVHFAIELAKL